MPSSPQAVAKAIVTCASESDIVAWTELKALFPSALPPIWLDQGDTTFGSLLLMDAHQSFMPFAAVIQRHPPLFVRHIAPVQREVVLKREESDLESLWTAVSDLIPLLDSTLPTSVQTRMLRQSGLPYRKSAIQEAFTARLQAECAMLPAQELPHQVVSILCTSNTGYVGVSSAAQNLSVRSGGAYRHLQEEAVISRAEFKLWEAVEVFRLSLPRQGRALDIGAAPGGWTHALRGLGMEVVAVDPAELDARLHGDIGIVHVRKRIQDYLPNAPQFDLIVNDMKMDARASAALMVQASVRLVPDGLAIMTLKLPPIVNTMKSARKLIAMIHADLEHLKHNYMMLGARQLYHNRNELTAVLQRRR